MGYRTGRERVIQALTFEAMGLLVAAPLYGFFFERESATSFLLIALLSAIMLLWVSVFNTLFDYVEWQRTRRVASARPHALRAAHAILLEASSTLITLPMVVIVGDHGVGEALMIEFGLTAFYVAYGYVFHLAFDHLRPVRCSVTPDPVLTLLEQEPIPTDLSPGVPAHIEHHPGMQRPL